MSCSDDSEPEPFDCAQSDLALEVVGMVATSTCSAADGSLEVAASGGVEGLEYLINGTSPQNNGIFTNLTAGTYEISVTDANGCTANTTASVGTPESVTISEVSSTTAGCGTAAGELTITAFGEGSVLYSLDQGDFQESNIFAGLAPGSYTVVVRDDLCETSQIHQVLSGVSYTAQIEPILLNNCTLSGCHDGNNALPDWTEFSEVQDNATGIKSRTQSGNMPPSSTGLVLTQEQKDLIACWVDDEALNN